MDLEFVVVSLCNIIDVAIGFLCFLYSVAFALKLLKFFLGDIL